MISNLSNFFVPGPEIIIIKPWQNKAQTAEVSPVSIMIALNMQKTNRYKLCKEKIVIYLANEV